MTKKTILHIDDEVDIRAVLAQFLQRSGYEVISAATPSEAFRALESASPDLIITDLQLDEADGLETVEQLKRNKPDLPVILLTGVLIDPQVARTTVGPKVSAYLEKTSPLSRILAEIKRLIGS